MTRKVVIVGGGILGAMLARDIGDEAEVTVLDAGHGGATGASFGWINASFFLDAAHHRLRAASMEHWRMLADHLPVTWSKALWWEAQGEALRAFQQELQGHGYPVELVDGSSITGLREAPEQALLFASEGWVDAAQVAEQALAASGARVLHGVAALGVEIQGDRAIGVRVEGGVIPADQVVIAAGNGAAALAEGMGLALPMLRRPGVLLRTQPVADPAQYPHIMVSPEMEFRLDGQGRFLAPTSASHQGDSTEVLDQSALSLAESALGRLREMTGRDLQLERVSAANRPVPGDGQPVIGRGGREGVYWMVMHSGVTLAPIAAALTAREMSGAEASDMLAPYRIDRFRAG